MNIPQLRFPEFSGKWEKKKLGEVFEFKVTNSFSRDNLNYDSGVVKNIHYGDIHTKFQTLFDITKEVVPFINDEMNVNRIADDFYCQEGDIIFADASEDLNDVGKSIEILNLNNEKLLSGLHTLLARPRKSLFFIGFGGYLFKSNNVRLQIQKEAQGSKVLSISTGRISNISINFPSLPEQQKIASFLTTVDEKLQALKKKKALLEQYKKGVIQKIFSQQLRFKADDGSEFPEWEVKKFSEFIKLYRGSSPRPINKYITKSENGINWIKIGDMKSVDNNLIEKVSEKITLEGALHSRKVEIGELILANSMSFGKTYQLNISGCIYDGWFVLREYEINFNKTFLLQLLNSDYLQKQYKILSTGGVVQNISSEIVYSTNLFKPSLPEQTKIANFLSAIDEKIQMVQGQVDKMEVWKKGLLQKMFV